MAEDLHTICLLEAADKPFRSPTDSYTVQVWSAYLQKKLINFRV
jgi:hypothetical protein